MYVKVRVTAGAKKEQVMRKSETEFAILVREPAARNLANKRVRELLSGAYGVPLGSVRLVSGHHAPSKIFAVETL